MSLDRAGALTHTTHEPIAELPRLARLREDLLEARYGLCTQKAELLTEAMRELAPPSPTTRRLAPIHFRMLQRSLERNLQSGAPVNHWALLANRELQHMWLALEQHQHGEPLVVAFARGVAHVLEHMQLRVYDHELLMGNPTRHRIGAALHPDYGGMLLLPELDGLRERPVNPLAISDEQIAKLRADVFPYWFTRSIMSRASLLSDDVELQNKLTEGRRFVLTQFAGISHVTPDFPRVLERGFEGVLDDIRLAKRSATTPEQSAFLQAAEIAARAVIRLAERMHERCLEQAEHAHDPGRAAELRELAAILAHVPARPARTLHEALQAMLVTWVAIQQESFQHGVSLGRVDQYLWPYYQADLAEGRIDRSRAVELLGCLLGKAAEQLPLFNIMATDFFSGLSSASGLTIGGVDEQGNDASNELTELLLHAYTQMRLRQPNIHLRLHPDSPAWLRELASETIAEGGGMPALFNDRAVIPALVEFGVPEADARDYSVVGCVEWGVPYRSFPAAGAGFISLPAVLDETLHDPDLRAIESPDMDRIWREFRARLVDRVNEAILGNEAIEQAHARWRPTPLLSLCVRGCIEAGQDVTAGGAQYDSSGIQGVGLADVADSLSAIEQLVIEERVLDLDALVSACDADFDGSEGEALRRRILDKVPKYGQDRGRPEWWAARVVQAFTELVAAHDNSRGGRYAPGLWSMTTHVGFGARLGALPSGRKAKRPLANGASPSNGSDARGPTASLLAASRVASKRIANGLALNETLDREFLRQAGSGLIDGLTRGYFDAGGMQVQYNVFDVEELIDAKQHPDRHRGLVVRISGYSAYFNDLTEAMKDELIARSLHGRPACQVTDDIDRDAGHLHAVEPITGEVDPT